MLKDEHPSWRMARMARMACNMCFAAGLAWNSWNSIYVPYYVVCSL